MPARMETIRQWLLLFLSIHCPQTPEAKAVQGAAVEAAMEVAFDPTEAPTQPTRQETALRLLAIELHETGLRPRLWRGECHLPKECDGGLATGEFQLHLHDKLDGLRLVGDRRLEDCLKTEPDCITPAIALDDHAGAARVALHMLRAGGLQGYTGQSANGPAVTWIKTVEQRFLWAHPAPMPPKE